ncbi:MAG: nitrate reductase [Betaproteobacteria bacterium RIFCSPLOWO2_02_FULL_65_24]|nr:MAG: nitrate reductase [Betaproteobacteria bacterium RIFCSPLOWO2_02_FULL_65_24]
MRETKSICCYCGVGCGVIIASDDARIAGVRGDPEHPANFGKLCTKGATLHLTARHDTRALYPEQREARGLARSRVTWDEALDRIAVKFASLIRAHGPDSVAFYISGQLLTEDYYVFNKLAKGLIGTNNVDTNSRLCMSSAASGYKASLGADAPPACYEDIDHAGCVFIAGSNAAYAHPVLFGRIEDAKARNPALKLIVVDPRRTDTAAMADLHLPILPGSDIALYNAMLHVLLWEGLVDHEYIRAHTAGFAAAKEIAREYTPAAAAELCGVPAGDIVRAAKWFGACTPTLSLYCQGLNQSVHGTHNNAALINLHLATGQIGKPGAGPFSLTGQANAMGGREVGGMATLLSAHRDLANPAHRAEVARLWGVDWVPAEPGKTAVELFQAIEEGKIKALWIACANPAQSMPDQNLVRKALATAELVVLQEVYRNTDTAAYADILLPASSWGEKEGTLTNSERRISRVRAAVTPPGEARADWEIVSDFARRLGAKLGDARAERLFAYRTTEEVFNEHRESTRGRDLDITGLSYARLEADGPQQWPLAEGAAGGAARLYTDGRFATADGRARFAGVRHQDTAERTDARYPLHLTTGRLRDQWHGMSRTGTVARLFNHSPEPYAGMHRDDMARRGLTDGDLVCLKSRRGKLTLRVQGSDELRPAQVFVPMHWGSQFMHGAGANALTASDFDPHSKQPELKHAAVQAEKVELPHTLVAMRRFGIDAMPSAQHLAERLQPLLAKFDYASVNLVGREHAVLVFRAYSAAPPDAAPLRELDRLLGLDVPESTMHYRDLRRGVFKAARVEGDAVIAVRLVGETAGEEWLKNMMVQGASAEAVRPWVLAPLLAPPRGTLNRGRIVCNCLDVSETEIRRELVPGVTLDALQARLKCGTECGSCLPELKKMRAALEHIEGAVTVHAAPQ